MVTDTVSDFISRIKNAIIVHHKIVQTPATRLTIDITKILKLEGFIEDFELVKNKSSNYLLIFLKYNKSDKKPVISFLKRISKPGRRIYLKNKNIIKNIGSFGISILSTTKGIVSNKKANKLNTGGEILLHIY